jgi:hypothetical protein
MIRVNLEGRVSALLLLIRVESAPKSLHGSSSLRAQRSNLFIFNRLLQSLRSFAMTFRLFGADSKLESKIKPIFAKIDMQYVFL